MLRIATLAATAIMAGACTLPAQTTDQPFDADVVQDDALVVGVADFASLPMVDGEPARMMLLVDEPGTGRLFVNDMRGPLYALTYDGSAVTRYLDVDDPRWGVQVESSGRERGVQSFAFHPDFGREGTPGYGRFYTWADTRRNDVDADFTPGGGSNTHHTVLLEWRAANPAAPVYDGGPPREILRFEQPFGNHNGGHLAFNPLAAQGDADYGLLYVGVADGGSGGDPLNLAQDPRSAFGKILRIDPLGSGGVNGRYGIPPDNPFVGQDGWLGEIWALGLRNPQRFGWDPPTGTMFVADIGQNIVEEVSVATAGANLGWNIWEGSFRYAGRQGVDASDPRSDPAMTYPVVEYAHGDPLLGSRAAATGVVVYRVAEIPGLTGRVLFGDFPSGEIFHFDANELPQGGNQGFRRVLLDDGSGQPRTFLELIQARNRSQGRDPASRTDLRFGEDRQGRVFLLNKHDGIIRRLVAGG